MIEIKSKKAKELLNSQVFEQNLNDEELEKHLEFLLSTCDIFTHGNRAILSHVSMHEDEQNLEKKLKFIVRIGDDANVYETYAVKIDKIRHDMIVSVKDFHYQTIKKYHVISGDIDNMMVYPIYIETNQKESCAIKNEIHNGVESIKIIHQYRGKVLEAIITSKLPLLTGLMVKIDIYNLFNSLLIDNFSLDNAINILRSYTSFNDLDIEIIKKESHEEENNLYSFNAINFENGIPTNAEFVLKDRLVTYNNGVWRYFEDGVNIILNDDNEQMHVEADISHRNKLNIDDEISSMAEGLSEIKRTRSKFNAMMRTHELDFLINEDNYNIIKKDLGGYVR